MARQLSLLEAPPSWQLDEHTREVGRRGVAAARASLQAALASQHQRERAGHDQPSHADRSAA